MSGTDWVAGLFIISDSDKKLLRRPIDQVSLCYANRLITKLVDCPEERVNEQYIDPVGRSHRYINWVHTNMSPMVAYMEVLMQTKFDLLCNTNMLLL